MLQCDVCQHEDVICDDFADHMSKKHQVLLESMEAIRAFTRTVGAFRKLNYCHNCGWRHSSSHTMREHKATHTTAGIIPATSAPPTTRPAEAAGSEAVTTPPPSVGIVTNEQRDVRVGEEDQYQLENFGERRRIRYNANPLQDVERAAGVGYDEPAAAQYQRCPFSVNVKCEGNLLPARYGPEFVRRRVYADRVPFPGLCRLMEMPEGNLVMRVDVVFHPNHPDKMAWPPRASAWNALGMAYEVAQTTTRTRLATVPVVAYFKELPHRGDFELLCIRDGECEARLYISDDAVFREGLFEFGPKIIVCKPAVLTPPIKVVLVMFCVL